MPYNSETGLYERRATTVIDATPDGDTVAVAIDDKLDAGIDDSVTDLNHHAANGYHYPATSVAVNSRYLKQSPAGVVSWGNGVPLDEAVESTLLAATDGSDMVGYGAGTVTDALDTHTADIAARPTAATLAASGGSALVGFLQDGTGATARTAQAKLRDFVSVKDFGADDTGVADSYAAFAAALAAEKFVYVPPGTYKILSPIILPTKAKIFGAGIGITTIVSGVIGDSLFKTSAATAFLRISDMTLQGNGLTGASGNGHAINLIDPLSSDGTFSPQASFIERIEVDGFRGQDVRDNSSATTIYACGVIMYNSLGNMCRDVYVEDCGHGFYFHGTQNCRVENCIASEIDKFALFAYDNENLIIDRCDLLNSGDGTADTGYPATSVTFGSGLVVSYGNQGFVLQNSKLKNMVAGSSLVRSLFSNGDIIQNCWIRASATNDVPHKAIYAERSYGINIVGNTFHPSATAFSASQKYKGIELYNNQTNDTFLARIVGNTFGDVAGMGIEYNIKLVGTSNTRSFQAVIEGNNFGFNGARSSACLVDADINITTCGLYASSIKNNLFVAPRNVTRTACILASTITDADNTIGPNKFSPNGGTITTEYSGIRKSVLWATVAYNPVSMADGSRLTTTVSVPGASPSLGDVVTVGFSADTLGVLIYGYVSAADTVTVVFQNNTGSSKDINSGFIRVKVERSVF